MSVIVIGDRAVGKSRMALALAKPNGESKVRIVDPSYETLKEELENPDTGSMVSTREIKERPVRLDVDLHKRQIIESVWVDTPGEWWETEWQKDHDAAWNGFKQKIAQNIGIILLLPPYKEIVSNSLLNQAPPDMTPEQDFMNNQRWCNNLENWLRFLNQNCSRVDNIAICLHKADLFCENLDLEAKKMQKNPVERQRQVRNRYFAVAKEVINRNNREERPFQFFITSISHRTLLEVPWLYLSPYILYYR